MINADVVLLNCNTITMDTKKPRAEAIAIKDGRFLMVGTNEEIKETIGKNTKIRDLGRMAVIPGFNDAHCHPLLFALAIKDVDLSKPDINSFQDILDLVDKQAKLQEMGTWINFRGYNQNLLEEKRHITRWELDKAAPNHLVRLRHFGLHSVVVNSKILILAGITKDTPDPEGGKIERDPNTGDPTGVLLEMPAIAIVDHVMPKPSYEDVIENLKIVNQRFLAEGITSFAHAGVGLQVDWPSVIGAYQEAVETDALQIRVSLQPWHEKFLDYSQIEQELDVLDSRLFKFGIRSGLGDEKLRIGPFKIIMDGGVSLVTAATYEPYGSDADNQGTGILTMEPQVLTKIVSALLKRGWQMAIHAIGDRTVDVVLNAYEAALIEHPRSGHRHRIEHCTIMNTSQMARMRELGIICVTQPHFIWDIGDSFFQQLGRKRTEEETLRFRTMLNTGVYTVFSSDRPCSSGTPLLGIHAAVNRKSNTGHSYNMDEAISVEEALRLYTINGAYTTFEEGIKGSIETGKLADLAVLADDPTVGDTEKIKDISVEATMVGGNFVYEK
jgi:predicted amidohydrolase YtcJ